MGVYIGKGVLIWDKHKTRGEIKEEQERCTFERTDPETEEKKARKKKAQKASAETRAEVLKRDGYACTECGATEYLEVHHLTARSKGGTNELGNLITLCDQCHANKHKGEAVYNLMMSKVRSRRELC